MGNSLIAEMEHYNLGSAMEWKRRCMMPGDSKSKSPSPAPSPGQMSSRLGLWLFRLLTFGLRLIYGTQCMHSFHVITHQDLKLQNILCRNMPSAVETETEPYHEMIKTENKDGESDHCFCWPVIADFGQVTHRNAQNYWRRSGAWNADPIENASVAETDIWQVGYTLSTILYTKQFDSCSSSLCADPDLDNVSNDNLLLLHDCKKSSRRQTQLPPRTVIEGTAKEKGILQRVETAIRKYALNCNPSVRDLKTLRTTLHSSLDNLVQDQRFDAETEEVEQGQGEGVDASCKTKLKFIKHDTNFLMSSLVSVEVNREKDASRSDSPSDEAKNLIPASQKMKIGAKTTSAETSMTKSDLGMDTRSVENSHSDVSHSDPQHPSPQADTEAKAVAATNNVDRSVSLSASTGKKKTMSEQTTHVKRLSNEDGKDGDARHFEDVGETRTSPGEPHFPPADAGLFPTAEPSSKKAIIGPQKGGDEEEKAPASTGSRSALIAVSVESAVVESEGAASTSAVNMNPRRLTVIEVETIADNFVVRSLAEHSTDDAWAAASKLVILPKPGGVVGDTDRDTSTSPVSISTPLDCLKGTLDAKALNNMASNDAVSEESLLPQRYAKVVGAWASPSPSSESLMVLNDG
ncbi:unnamed protein product, partial [Amoebophrya sp. A25]|eukprot:GSA25T00006018001.1